MEQKYKSIRNKTFPSTNRSKMERCLEVLELKRVGESPKESLESVKGAPVSFTLRVKAIESTVVLGALEPIVIISIH